ncbi:acetate/propionate family kinase [Actinoallomurus rhizosphaericola]|uniref:acetate/propionate family kinase n=1 Tax=Actinoallomurus rhizosphaericola TaxID=2952536 RepID=UPI00209339A8|nr:acetate/propionate family kinase [Actinoallomurus rhizosphaericola]MCO5996750.1 acetate/propionate family kinase [Actinoallomurus rhizosphaericola]
MRVLVVNAGSSSLKLSLLDADDTVLATLGSLEELADLPAPDAIGHRIVHGGREFIEPVLIDDDVERRLRALVDLAPLHQPKSLHGIDAVRAVLPGTPEVACFDTAFHAGLPPAAATYALPASWREKYGLRRFGFHGLSHAYAARRTGELLGADSATLRIVVCHLGAGASLCAVAGGRSVDTTMGFTPLEGLVMATRSGSVDPGLLLWLQQHEGVAIDDLAEVLEHESGLLALAGTPDMRQILAREDADATLALEVYLHRLRGLIAQMAAAMGGLDVLVFTGGVGEHAPEIRRRAADGLAFLGVRVDAGRNAAARGDADIGAPGAAVRSLVVAAREDLEVAAGTRAVLSAAPR